MNPIISNGNKLRWKFENVRESLINRKEYNDGMDSEKFSIDSVDWRINIDASDGGKNLFIFLKYASVNSNGWNWICEVDAKYKLIDQSREGEHLVGEAKCCVHGGADIEFIAFFESDKNTSTENFMKNDSIVIEFEMNFKYYDFSKKIPNFTDIIVNVKGTDFHLNKGALSLKSSYFYDLFVNGQCEDTVIQLNDIDAYGFSHLLASFYPYFDGISDDNYEELIKVAAKFGVPSLHRLCEEFLINETGIEIIEKIKYADDNGYEKLMRYGIESLEIGDDIKILHESEMFSKLKKTTKLRIMQRLLDIY